MGHDGNLHPIQLIRPQAPRGNMYIDVCIRVSSVHAYLYNTYTYKYIISTYACVCVNIHIWYRYIYAAGTMALSYEARRLSLAPAGGSLRPRWAGARRPLECDHKASRPAKVTWHTSSRSPLPKQKNIKKHEKVRIFENIGKIQKNKYPKNTEKEHIYMIYVFSRRFLMFFWYLFVFCLFSLFHSFILRSPIY